MEFTRRESLQILGGLVGYKQTLEEQYRVLEMKRSSANDYNGALFKRMSELEDKISELDNLIDSINEALLKE